MIPFPPITDAELNDYVDGRLSDQRRSDIERWLRANPLKTAEVERMKELNEALRGLGSGVLDEPVPDRLREVLRRGEVKLQAVRPGPEHAGAHPEDRPAGPAAAPGSLPPARRRMPPRFLEAAAVLLVFVIGGAVGWGARGLLDDRRSLELLLQEATYAFNMYAALRERAVEFPPERAPVLEALSTQLFSRYLAPPDLTPLGYRYMGARIAPTAQRPGAFFFFEGGPKGPLTLVFWPAEPGRSIETFTHQLDGVESRYWSEAGYDFAVLARAENREVDDIAGRLTAHYHAQLRPP